MKLRKHCFKNNEEVCVALRALQPIQKKLDAQQGILEKFKMMLKIAQVEHKVVAKKTFMVEKAIEK